MPSLPRTLEQDRAKSAWDDVQAVNQRDDETFKKSYSSLARSTPALVMTAGLGQTLAFLHAKGRKDSNKAHTHLYNHVSNWVMGQLGAQGSLLEWVIDPAQGTDDYRRATAETLAYLGWLKRFAEAELPEPDPDTES